MAETIWIRRDRGTGKESEVTDTYVFYRIIDVYKDKALAMQYASKENPLTTGFADYYPKKSD